MVERLAARMKENPDDAEGWAMLGRSYAVLDRYAEAAAAYANAVKRSEPDAQLLADYADALAMAQGRNLKGEPERLIAQALKVDPQNVKALVLAGTVAFEKKDFKGAIAYWERILKVVPPDSDIAESVRDSIADARKFAGTAKAAPSTKPGAAPAAASVSGTVRLSPGVAAKAAPDDTVFIFARAGGRAPHAARRHAQARARPPDRLHAGRFDGDDAGGKAVEPRAGRGRRARLEERQSRRPAGRSRGTERAGEARRHRHRRGDQLRSTLRNSEQGGYAPS